MAGIAVGGVIGLEALFAGPISGASMNPARSLAPAVVSANLHFLWIYLIAPFLGSLVAVTLWKYPPPTLIPLGGFVPHNHEFWSTPVNGGKIPVNAGQTECPLSPPKAESRIPKPD